MITLILVGQVDRSLITKDILEVLALFGLGAEELSIGTCVSTLLAIVTYDVRGTVGINGCVVLSSRLALLIARRT